MSCLNAGQIYLFLENEIDTSERERIDRHLAACSKCRQAVKERQALLLAADSLPRWEPPPGFTERVMAGILPQRSALKNAFLAVAVICSSLVMLVFGYLFLAGRNLMDFFMGVNNTILSAVRTISVTAAQGYKILSALIRVLGEIFSFLSKSFLKLTAVISPQLQIVLIVITLMAAVALFVTLRKKFMIGERT